MRATSMLLVTAAAVALAAPRASAQTTRDGLYVGFGAGYGSAKVDFLDNEVDDREGSFTANIRVGTTISDRALAGLELNGWFDSENGDSLSLYNATLALYYYPADSGLFVKGGVGLSRAEVEIGELNDKVSGVGWGVMAGLGYDIAIGDTTALTPMATFWYGKPGELKFEDITVLEDVKHNVFEAGLSLTFY